MLKTKLINSDIAQFESQHFTLYAHQTYKNKPLSFLINSFAVYRVIHGSDTVYEGTSRYEAIEAWEAV